MNRGIHWISANGAFQQLMDAGCASNGRGAHNILVVSASVARLRGGKLRVVMGMRMMKAMVLDLILIDAIRWWHTLNVVQVHGTHQNPKKRNSKKKKKKKNPVIKIGNLTNLNHLGISPFFKKNFFNGVFLLPSPILFVLLSLYAFLGKKLYQEKEEEGKEKRRRKMGMVVIDGLMMRWVILTKPNHLSMEEQVLFFLLSLTEFEVVSCEVRERKKGGPLDFRD